MNRSLLWIIVAVTMCAGAFGATIVVPNANTNAVGNDTDSSSGTISIGLQIVNNASQFPSASISITGFGFRAAPNTGADSINVTGNAFLSYSPNSANSVPGPLLSTTFANNIGANRTLVASLNNVTVTTPSCTGAGPCAFGSGFVFTTPFTYNPANGSLLLEVQLSSLTQTGTLDAITCPSTSCVANTLVGAPGASTGSVVNGLDVTQFTYTALPAGIPVPPSIMLTMVGLACAGFFVGFRGLKLA